ncbi:MAG: winged-helix domain-containing protein [Patescibacteria group bacterium]
MDDRKKAILSEILEEYIKSAKPIGSKAIVDKYYNDLSSATIRNEMKTLEKEGFITHPHTSAGRIPTEKGYQFYIDNFLKEKEVAKSDREFIQGTISHFKNYEPDLAKNLAKAISHLSDETVFVAFSENDFFYTGISNIFKKPEFADLQLVYNISEIIDHMDEVLNELFTEIDQGTILLGQQNPFGDFCSSVITKYHNESQSGLLGILGPLRMDYNRNRQLVNYAEKLLSS